MQLEFSLFRLMSMRLEIAEREERYEFNLYLKHVRRNIHSYILFYRNPSLSFNAITAPSVETGG